MKRFCDIYRVALVGAVALAAFPGIVWGDEFSVAEGKNWSLHVREAKDGAVVMAVPRVKPSEPVKLCDAVMDFERKSVGRTLERLNRRPNP